MTQTERAEMLSRFTTSDRWLARVYDPQRSDAHRVAIWHFLVSVADSRLKNILISTRQLDEETVKFWDTYGKN